MIDKATFELEWINRIADGLGKRGDRKILEKVIHAFALLEQLKIAGLNFIFKGGTSLLLLSQTPRRFSIDIDIITSVNPEELADYLEIYRQSLSQIDGITSQACLVANNR